MVVIFFACNNLRPPDGTRTEHTIRSVQEKKVQKSRALKYKVSLSHHRIRTGSLLLFQWEQLPIKSVKDRNQNVQSLDIVMGMVKEVCGG